MSISFNWGAPQRKGPLGQLLKVVGALLVLAAACMFSLVFIAVLAIAGLSLWLYFWWTTRALRRQIREHLAASQMGAPHFAPDVADPVEPAAGGQVIEGEAVRVADEGRRRDE